VGHYQPLRFIRHIFLLLGVTFILSSCATEFERIRSSNDQKLILAKAHEFYKEKDYPAAQALYELSIQFYRGKIEAEEIFFNYAYTYYHLGEYITASHYFKNFASTYYNSDKKEEAEYMAAYSHYNLSPNYRLDQSYSVKAIEAFQEFINKYPNSPRVKSCNELIDKMRLKLETKSFEQGLLYYNIGQYQAAVRSFENLLKDFPGSKSEEEAKFLMIKASFVLAENSIYDKKAERFEETIVLCRKYMDKISNKNFKKEVKDILNSATQELKNNKV